ncbi:MAG TPA: hypothetical protein VFU10_06420 [Gaiellaceae bacterium]|nr:hypothetical protein [Gaiellaceae bacterium]
MPLHELPAAELMGSRNAAIRFPNRTFVLLALAAAPQIGMTINAQGEWWKVTRVRWLWGLDEHGDVVYDIDVEPAPPILPPDS